MSIFDFFKKNKTPKFEEVASNKHNPQEEVSKSLNAEDYQRGLVSLASSFFVFQANCARIATQNDLLSANVLYNANNSYGAPTIEPTTLGAVRFFDYCNAVKQNPNLDTTLDKSHNGNIFANNLLTKSNFNKEELDRDIKAIDAVLNGVYASYGDKTTEAGISQTEDSSATFDFKSFQRFYLSSPKYAFDSEDFNYPGVSNKNINVSKISDFTEQEVSDSLLILAGAERNLIETVEQVNATVQNFGQ